MTAPRTPKFRILGVSVTVLAGLVLSACATGASGTDAGEGIGVGATKQEYIAAFSDVPETTLISQAIGAQGSVGIASYEDYLDTVEEWSGGKIVFERFYSGAIAPANVVHEAMNDGRIDIGQVVFSYAPDEFPAWTTLDALSFLGDQGPTVAPAQFVGWATEAAFTVPEFGEEADRAGVHVLAPALSTAPAGTYCTDPDVTSPADFAGKSISGSGPAKIAQIEALGGSPVSLPFTEAYDALQRGVISCIASNPTATLAAGLLDVAPNMTIVPSGDDINQRAGQSLTPLAIGMSADVWESLPLVAQQLLFDRLEAMLEATFTSIDTQVVEALQTMDGNGGGVQYYDKPAQTALAGANDAIVDAIVSSDTFADPESYLDLIGKSTDYWAEVAAESGIPSDVKWTDYLSWSESNSVDPAPFFAQIAQELYADRRPE